MQGRKEYISVEYPACPKYIDSVNKGLYFSLDNAGKIFNDFPEIFKKHSEINKADSKQRKIDKLQKELEDLKK